jgi:rare lipoprotein A
MTRLTLLLLAVLVCACATAPKTPPRADAPKKPSYYSDDGPPESVPDNLASIPDAVPRDEPFHRYANRPYAVFGRNYTPAVNKDPMKERGIASWYGKKFHGQKTSSGEVYDMFAMTAAHKTLPIPSYAKVTNVKDGRSVVVRINDRGPFHGDRIIDLSYAAALRIGVASAGSGLVDVERVFEVPLVASVIPPASAAQAPLVETAVVTPEPTGLWLQLGAFSGPDNAENFRQKMTRELAWNLEPLSIAQRDGLHRVRLGPYRNRDEALAIADKVRESLGYAPTLSTH